MPNLTLFCAPGACSRATMIALEEAGARYDTRFTNLLKGEQRGAEYLRLNAKGKVPVLLIGDVPLSENVAIMGWLHDTYPDAGLLPRDALLRAEGLSAVAWLASGVLPVMSRIVRPERVTDEAAAHDGIRVKAREDIAASMAIADRHMQGRTWWLDRWSVADAYLYYMAGAVAKRGVDMSPFGNLAAHASRMEERPSVQRMLAWEQQATAAAA